jgi:UDP-N-acetylglucosamine 1-carboxyvinyltransferase
MVHEHRGMNDSRELLIIDGPRIASGTIRISGAKNSAICLIAAALLTDEEVHITNFPSTLEDIKNKLRLMEQLGVAYDLLPDEVVISAGTIANTLCDYNSAIRTTYLLAAGQLHRNGVARIPYPGGCPIGDRKYDLHLKLWEMMGCRVSEEESYIQLECDRLVGCDIHFPLPTIGGTENALLCGAVAEGTTHIRNSYISPEVLDLVQMLTSMGARISVEGTTFIEIEGVRRLSATSHRVIPDRLEAVSWIITAAVTGGTIKLLDVPFEFIEVPLIHLRYIGVDFRREGDVLHVNADGGRRRRLDPFVISCGVYPGVVTDVQPFFTVLATQADGHSRIVDYRYPRRFAYIEELRKMGGEFVSEVGQVMVEGPVALKGSDVVATDIRGGAALLVAALIAKGRTVIGNPRTILRGYDNLLNKITALGIPFETSGDLS